jgi:hypothetical protein
MEHNPLLGTWKLISATAINPDGTVDPEVTVLIQLATSLILLRGG